MKWAAVIGLSFCAGVGVDYYLLRSVFPTWVRHKPEVADGNRLLREDTAKNWDGGLASFGLKQGDLILSVNGNKDQTMFQELVDGDKRGKVCVIYERNEKKREVCLEKK